MSVSAVDHAVSAGQVVPDEVGLARTESIEGRHNLTYATGGGSNGECR